MMTKPITLEQIKDIVKVIKDNNGWVNDSNQKEE